MGKLGWNSGYIGSDQRDTARGAVGYSKYYLERTDGRFLPSLFDADALAFFNRVVVAGGALSSAEQIAINQLVLDMKAYGIWDKMKAVYPMVGASAAACAQNLISSNFTGTFSSGWTFSSTGVTPNGVSAYMNTGLVPNGNLSLNSSHITSYSRTNTSNSNDGMIGVYSNENTSAIRIVYSGGSYYCENNVPFTDAAFTYSIQNGFFINTRINSTEYKTFRNSSLINTKTNSPVNLPIHSIYLGAINVSGNATFPSIKQNAFASIGDGLTDADAANLYTVVQAFQTTLGRQV